MAIIIVGEDRFLLKSSKGQSTLHIKDLVKYISIENRVIFNNGDFLIQYKIIPKINFLLKERWVKNYIFSKKKISTILSGRVFNHDSKLSNILNTILPIKNTITYNFLTDIKNTLAVAEHFAFILPNILQLKNSYWLVLSENSTKNISITIGFCNAVLLHRSLEHLCDIKYELEKSVLSLKDFINAQNLKKIVFTKSYEHNKDFLSFKVYNEYGDVYISKKLSEYNTSKPFLVINNKEYIKMKCNHFFRKLLICLLPIILVLIIVNIQQNYDVSCQNNAIYKENNTIQNSIAKINDKIKNMLRYNQNTNNQYQVSETPPYRVIDREYIRKSYERLDKELKDLEEVINKNKEIVFGKPTPIDEISNFELILPKGISLIHYNYSFSDINENKNANIDLVISVDTGDDNLINVLINNIKKYAKGFNISTIKRISEDKYRISLKK